MRQTPPTPEAIRAGFYPDIKRGWRRAELIGGFAMRREGLIEMEAVRSAIIRWDGTISIIPKEKK